MKRYVVVVLIFILAAVPAYFYFSGNQTGFTKDSAIYKAVPTSAPFFFEFGSAKSANARNAMISELSEAGIGKSWFHFLEEADSLVAHSDALPKSLLNERFLLAWGITGRNQMVPIIIKKADSESKQKQIKTLFNSLYPPAQFSSRERIYGDNTITEIKRSETDIAFSYAFVEDLLLASPKPILIEQVILQMSTPGILRNPLFREVYKSTGSKGAAFFINHSRTDAFFNNILNRTVFEKTDEFGAPNRYQPAVQASKFREYAGWSGLDFQFDNNLVTLSGITTADDSLNHFLSVFNGQQPQHCHAEEVLPANTSFYCSYSFSDKESFFDRLEEFYTHSPEFYRREERMKRFDAGFRTNTRRIFSELVNDEAIVATNTIPVDPANKTVYFLFHSHGNTATLKQLKALITTYAARIEKEPAEFMSEFSVDNETTFPVYRFPYPSFPGLWLGSPFTMADANFVTLYDNFVVFCNTKEGLHEYLRNRVLETTLSNNPAYKQSGNPGSGKANINVFVDINKAFGYRSELFSEAILKPVNKIEDNLRKFGMVKWQVQNENGRFLNSVSVSFQPVMGEEAKTTWQSVIGNNLQVKPQIMVNHTQTATADILVQDVQNNLLQVSNSGRIRWSIPLSGPVLSEIHQVDVYKNGRLQYLFNTRDKLYVIDRNGNNIQNFPIVLSSPATNGVNVFDYDKNRNYRIFLAAEDKKIYAFDQEGKIIKGWNFGNTEQEVATPVQYFKVEGKDYIVFKDKTGIYICDRQGEQRVSVASRFNHSKNPLVLNENGKPKIVATDVNGKVLYIYFDGRVEEKKTARFSENHFFTVNDLDGNNIPEFIFADGNEITVLNENGRKVFSQKFNSPILYKPGIYTFSPKLKKIGITDAATNRIYLINPDGKPHEGFPLQGNSEFSIGKLSGNSEGLNLIVGSEGGLLFNYTLMPPI